MESYALTAESLSAWSALRGAAVDAVTRRFYETHAAEYARFGERGRAACREDLEFQLQFLRPVL